MGTLGNTSHEHTRRQCASWIQSKHTHCRPGRHPWQLSGVFFKSQSSDLLEKQVESFVKLHQVSEDIMKVSHCKYLCLIICPCGMWKGPINMECSSLKSHQICLDVDFIPGLQTDLMQIYQRLQISIVKWRERHREKERRERQRDRETEREENRETVQSKYFFSQ